MSETNVSNGGGSGNLLPDRQWIEPEELPRLGWVWIHEVGEENIYFQYENQARIREGFCKVDGFQYQGGGSCAQ